MSRLRSCRSGREACGRRARLLAERYVAHQMLKARPGLERLERRSGALAADTAGSFRGVLRSLVCALTRRGRGGDYVGLAVTAGPRDDQPDPAVVLAVTHGWVRGAIRALAVQTALGAESACTVAADWFVVATRSGFGSGGVARLSSHFSSSRGGHHGHRLHPLQRAAGAAGERARVRRERARAGRPRGRRRAGSAARLPAHQGTPTSTPTSAGSRSACCRRVRRRRPLQRRPDHRGRGDLRGRPRLRLHGARQRARADAGLVLGQRGAEGPVPAGGDVRSDRRVPRRLRGERAGRDAGRHRELRRAAAAPGRHRRDRRLDGDEYVLNGRKYWPCNVAGWDGKGANVSIVVVRTDSGQGRHGGAVGDHGRARHAGRQLQADQQDRPPADARTPRSSSTTPACRPTTSSRARAATATC